VAFERFLKCDFSCARYFETLFGTRICFNLWHITCGLKCYPAGGFAQAKHLWGRLGNSKILGKPILQAFIGLQRYGFGGKKQIEIRNHGDTASQGDTEDLKQNPIIH
jgi:hypothetical protein